MKRNVLVLLLILCFSGSVLVCYGSETPQLKAGNIPAGINTAQLVRQVRESESWIHKVDSFYVKIENRVSSREDKGAALSEPKTQTLEFAFDQSRVRYMNIDSDYMEQLLIWDGKELKGHEKYFESGQEQYQLNSTFIGFFPEYLARQTSWPRAQPHSFWFDVRDVNDLMCYYGRENEFVLSGSSDYQGIDCYVLDYNPQDIRCIIGYNSPLCEAEQEDQQEFGRIGEVRGLPGQTYRWYVGKEDGLLHSLVWLDKKGLNMEFQMLDYREVAPGCKYPMKQVINSFAKDGTGKAFIKSSQELKIVDIQINEKLADAQFDMELKEGAVVADNRNSRPLHYTYKSPPPDLTGKVLPDFGSLSIDLSSADVENKQVLVCFIDYQQRPSRYMVNELSRLSEALKEKDITVILVQASKVEKNALNQWLEKSKTSFPFAMVENNEENIMFDWGVKSLPWLILTDRKHTVCEQCLALSELNENLNKLN